MSGRRRDLNDPPNAVVSGWQIYDNKGRVVVDAQGGVQDYLAVLADKYLRGLAVFRFIFTSTIATSATPTATPTATAWSTLRSS